MENDLEILQDIIQNEYNNNKDIQLGDICISKDNSTFYFYLDGQESAEVGLYKANIILELIAGKMHGEHIICPAEYVDLANNIYSLYKEYIRESDYYI